jgi:hypothetical protein
MKRRKKFSSDREKLTSIEEEVVALHGQQMLVDLDAHLDRSVVRLQLT